MAKLVFIIRNKCHNLTIRQKHDKLHVSITDLEIYKIYSDFTALHNKVQNNNYGMDQVYIAHKYETKKKIVHQIFIFHQ